MNYSPNKDMLNQYRQVGAQSGVASASPHRLIQMLMEGALEKINLAKGYMQRGETALKGSHISWAISIIDGLRMSLDKEQGGEVAQNLDDLYDYMGRRLAEANLKNSVEMLDEVAGLLTEIKSAWDSVPSLLQDSNTETA
jgi:flagellar protein FliS